MTTFQKLLTGVFVATRAGRGGALLLLPVLLLTIAVFWIIGKVGDKVIRSIAWSNSDSYTAEIENRYR